MTVSCRQRLPVVTLCALASCVVFLPLAGCRQAASVAAAPPAGAKDRAAPEVQGVALKPGEIEKAGIVTTPAAAIERQSRSALARGRNLAGTPGAMPIETQEATERQATVDHAALLLAERRLSATYGRNAPWKDNYRSPELASLASGETKLARVTFPLGALGPATPAKLRFAHLGETPGGRSFESIAVWSAPADASIPGRSFFAVLKGGDAGEGERLVARAAIGAAEAGVLVPFSATVISGGSYWVYVEQKPGLFVRTAIDTSMPTDDGYFVKGGIAPGAKIVTTSAGQLLAREINPGTEAE